MLKDRTHIVFGNAAKGTLEGSLNLKSVLGTVISLNDDLRIGPITNLNATEGIHNRQKWFKNTFRTTIEVSKDLSSMLYSDIKKLDLIRQVLEKGQEVYIWCGFTSFNQITAARLLSKLKVFSNKIFILDIPKEERIISKVGISFFPECLTIMAPDQVHLLVKHFKLLSTSNLESWTNLWDVISKEKGTMRVNLNEQIGTVLDSYFDKVLIQNCTKTFEKIARIIGVSLVEIGFQVSDSILNWRLEELVHLKRLETKGSKIKIRDGNARLSSM